MIHQPCPASWCNSSDGFVEYPDGGAHCFSCGYHVSANKYAQISQSQTSIGNMRVVLPQDAITVIPNKPLLWLHKYGITDAQIASHKFLFSASRELLIFPVYQDGTLLFWQGRYFGNLPRHPKYITRGNSPLHILGKGKSEYIVLVEDLLSAIRVAEIATAMPLWGSHVSAETARRIATQYSIAKLWLDYDKRETSIRTAVQQCMRLTILPVITSEDPKCYSKEDILTTIGDEYYD